MLTITNEDCMELMARYPDGYFDLAIVDPPYGIGANQMNRGNAKIRPDKKQWDSEAPKPIYFQRLFKVSSQQVIWGGNYFSLPPSQYFAIWDKGETMYGRDFAECEYAWVSSGGTRIFKSGPNQNDRIHPTQKTVALYKWLLEKYAKPIQDKLDRPMRILDTHLGSGSIAIACHDYGYDLTACELDTDYYNAAMKRIAQHTSQLKLL